jgi:hypothetical protein
VREGTLRLRPAPRSFGGLGGGALRFFTRRLARSLVVSAAPFRGSTFFMRVDDSAGSGIPASAPKPGGSRSAVSCPGRAGAKDPAAASAESVVAIRRNIASFEA